MTRLAEINVHVSIQDYGRGVTVNETERECEVFE
jgi:hypothetical protein